MTTVNAAASATAQAQTRTAVDRGKLSETYDNFLKLLTTQLKNQDPLAPMDSAQFTQQLVLYSQVEQQIGQNEKLQTLIGLQTAAQTQASLGFIGLDVEAAGNQVSFDGEPVRLSYDMPAGATAAKIQILDASGKTVRVVDAERTPGTHEYSWDGRTSGGTTAEPGAYTIKIAAVDGNNKSLNVATTVFGRITGIETTETGDTLLVMGRVYLTLDQIRSATQPKAAA